jgi:hypothetical protein
MQLHDMHVLGGMRSACMAHTAKNVHMLCNGAVSTCRSKFLFLEHFPVDHRQFVVSLQLLLILERQRNCVAKAI